jgi:gas vesicle structural protein
VIDAFVRVAVIGIELITIDARIVVASVDTYLRFAEAVNRLDLTESGPAGLRDLVEEGPEKMAEGTTEGVLEGAQDKLTPSGSTARTAAKGVATAAALGAAAVAAREIASRVGSDGSGGNGNA